VVRRGCEKVRDGPDRQDDAGDAPQATRMVMVVSIYEEEITGVYYTPAAVSMPTEITRQNRKNPHTHTVLPAFGTNFYLNPQSRYPTFENAFARSGYISAMTDIPEGARGRSD